MDSLAPTGDVAKAMSVMATIDLTSVMRKLRHDEGWTEAEAATAGQRYRRFLCMRFLDPELELVPARDIDKVWHQHILHTHDYARDCQRVFGAFLHHEPGAPDDAPVQERLRADLARTQARYAELFGEEYVATWLTYLLR
jgi:hypothetical protein